MNNQFLVILRIMMLWGLLGYAGVGFPQNQAPEQGNSAKVSTLLRMVIDQLKAPRRTGIDPSTFSNPLVSVDNEENIQTYIYWNTIGESEKATLKAHGVIIELINEDLGIIQAWIRFNKIDEVAELPFVKRIDPPSYGQPRVGSVTTEGVAIHKADILHAQGIDGSGTKVGVISDGITSLAAAQATGDVPAAVTVQTFLGGGDEGTAMLEIVHDMAPGATLGFCGPRTSLEMAQCIIDLADPSKFGAHVIVDDLGFYGEPYFEDGIIAQAAAFVVANNVVYASSAGNDGQSHYQAPYVDSGDGVGTHQIAPGNTVFDVVGGNNVVVILQWSNLAGSSGDDYNLCLQGETPAICATFNTVQDGDDFPGEFRILDCTAGCDLEVRQITGNPQTLELFALGGGFEAADRIAADGIFGHPAVPGVLATAAVNANDPGHDDVEFFSSRGPSTLLSGVRQKPDIAAVDGVTVTGVGGFPSPFLGTSAAAPHVAGCAALVRHSLGGTAAEITSRLKNTATAIATPDEAGAGLMDCSRAAAAPAPVPAMSLWGVIATMLLMGLVPYQVLRTKRT